MSYIENLETHIIAAELRQRLYVAERKKEEQKQLLNHDMLCVAKILADINDKPHDTKTMEIDWLVKQLRLKYTLN